MEDMSAEAKGLGLSESILLHFSSVEDPRVVGRCRHDFLDIIFVTVCAVLCGAESFLEIEEFGFQKVNWLKKFAELPNGIPSHDTFSRLFSTLDVKQFERAFANWVISTLGEAKLKRICFDGKSVNGTDRKINGKTTSRLHLLNVFSHEHGLALGQTQCKSTAATEADAILEYLELLDIEGALISVDAVSSSARVTSKIRERKGDYICPIKRNQRPTLRELEKIFYSIPKVGSAQIDQAFMKEKKHGRVEERYSSVVSAKKMSDHFQSFWPGVKSIIRIIRSREDKDTRPLLQKKGCDGKVTYTRNTKDRKRTTETAYYISSRCLSAEESLQEVRDHWSIENKLHWSLDVVFSEDSWRVKEKTAATNLAIVRKYAFNLIKKCSQKGGQRMKMKRASWNEEYLESLILGRF
jgi:predicted transposase YbfD/YdcC